MRVGYSATLDEINLAHNDIGDQGADILAEFLANNGTLKRIHLNDNNIGANGAFQLCMALEFNRTLTEITLGYAFFYHHEAEELVKSLQNKKIVSKIMISFFGHENYDINYDYINSNYNYSTLSELLIENLRDNYR
ncbi:hypothetical protein [Candidatus Tisiphia endosymbiont of Ditula angustiorana]|uniref:hypothetical protein n=1 Tax=Candidatus Tisiphia endosymbiont of Ditula angustiorana TaxID=3066272 RepID=UPI00312C8C92